MKKLLLGYLSVYLGGIALLVWAIVYSHMTNDLGAVVFWELYTFMWVGVGLLIGISLAIRLAIAAWEIRFAARNWEAGREQYYQQHHHQHPEDDD
jgi:hypothetical protein